MYIIASNEYKKRRLCLWALKESLWLIKELGFAKMVSEILISPAVLWGLWICAMDNNRLTAEVVDVVFIRNSFFTAVTWHHHVAT